MTETTNKMKNEIEHGKKLASSHAELTWGWNTTAGQKRAARRAAWLISAANLQPQKSVLEVGCGTGLFTKLFAQSEASLTALDISEDLITIARTNVTTPNVEFSCAPFESFVKKDTFDAVVGSSILHHLDIKPALENIYALLKPGGRLAFAEPNMMNPQIMIQKNIPYIKERMGDSPDETAFFRWQLRKWLSRIGFIDIKIVPRDWLHPATPQKMIPLVENIGHMLEKTPLLREFSGSLYISAEKPK